MMQDQLQEVREWAKTKIASGAEPPWAWFQYMKLVETLDAILGAQDSATATASSRQSGPHSEMRLQLVGSTYQPDSVPPHSAETPVLMPM